ncbi:MAG: hypothetical protein OEY66_07095 [Gammaproteobacteria bacterium]|nr:hypothetical protein [Gammaproteobacteria bacterium]
MKIIPDILGIAGLGLVGYGVAQWSVPAACVVVGVVLMFSAYRMAKK